VTPCSALPRGTSARLPSSFWETAVSRMLRQFTTVISPLRGSLACPHIGRSFAHPGEHTSQDTGSRPCNGPRPTRLTRAEFFDRPASSLRAVPACSFYSSALASTGPAVRPAATVQNWPPSAARLPAGRAMRTLANGSMLGGWTAAVLRPWPPGSHARLHRRQVRPGMVLPLRSRSHRTARIRLVPARLHLSESRPRPLRASAASRRSGRISRPPQPNANTVTLASATAIR